MLPVPLKEGEVLAVGLGLGKMIDEFQEPEALVCCGSDRTEVFLRGIQVVVQRQPNAWSGLDRGDAFDKTRQLFGDFLRGLAQRLERTVQHDGLRPQVTPRGADEIDRRKNIFFRAAEFREDIHPTIEGAQ